MHLGHLYAVFDLHFNVQLMVLAWTEYDPVLLPAVMVRGGVVIVMGCLLERAVSGDTREGKCQRHGGGGDLQCEDNLWKRKGDASQLADDLPFEGRHMRDG